MGLYIYESLNSLGLVFFIIFASDGKFNNSIGTRKRTD